MLELKQITKQYVTGDSTVQALKGIDLKFRENEFVSVLGPSGCGKTTLLNIIGGLDQYTSGDLIINGTSTKKFKNRDWDAYRNHTIGFVFQSYNLISHQTVLSNVELALTLSGVSREERHRRAIEALEKVGLGDQLKKKPNQMSGGQMQRVAIARALVNNPDILLADEPTGALDSTTSLQIMELLKEVAKDRLVIMVTHNPELAEQYSTRIIRLKDGTVTGDTNPCTDASTETAPVSRRKKTSMSFFTALSLSRNNLMTKKGRTFMIAFAGSIGIIGIALILSLSNGVQNYINRVEEDTLTSYPLSIESTSMDMTSLMTAMMGTQTKDSSHDLDKVYSNNMMNDMMDMMVSEINTNDLQAFKKYLESGETNIQDLVSDIQYTYNTPLNIYKTDTSDGVVQLNPSTIMSSMGMGSMGAGTSSDPESSTDFSAYSGSSMMASQSQVWTELVGNDTLLNSQYTLLAGRLPENYDEVVLITDQNNEVTDYTLYSIGLMDASELTESMKSLMMGNEADFDTEQTSYSYEDILGLTFKLVANTSYYEKENGVWVDQRNDQTFLKNLVDNGETIHIVGIGNIGYTSELMEHLIQEVNDSEIAKEQLADPDTNVFTGKPFSNSTYEANLTAMGISNLDVPSGINIYPKDFDSKKEIAQIISDYNDQMTADGNDNLVIQYTDLIDTMMSSVTTIITAVSSILIAFVAISLIVSSIMIGIITYISVLERTKEIGILRSIGASKKDISRVFNAETLIIGLCAGILGIAITQGFVILINILVERSLDIADIAALPPVAAVILVCISMVLTLIAGLIPSRMASKKDPVKALRCE